MALVDELMASGVPALPAGLMALADASIDLVVPVTTAAGDGVTDDTTVLQAAINSLLPGQVIGLRGGATYCVTGLTIPQTIREKKPIGIIALGGMAILKAIGTPVYVLASANWANNVLFDLYPVFLQNLILDGNSLATYGYADISFQSWYQNLQITGAVSHGYYAAGTTQSGSAYANVPQNNRFTNCDFFSNGGDGFHSDIATDFHVQGGYIHNNGGWGIYNAQMAGWSIKQIHTYLNTTGGGYFDKLGFNDFIGAGNVFEDAVTLNGTNSTTHTAIVGPGNQFQGLVTVSFATPSTGESLTSTGNVYNSAAGRLYHGSNAVGHILFTKGDSFFVAPPFLWNGANGAVGQIYAVGSTIYMANSTSGVLDGLQTPSAGTLASPGAVTRAPNTIGFRKALSTVSTTTTLVGTVVVASANGAGFTATGTLDAYVYNSGTGLENYTADVQINYVRQIDSTNSAKSAQIINAFSTGAGISAAIGIVDSTTTTNNTVTVTITITHPQGNGAVDSQTILSLNSRDRSVTGVVWL